MAEELTQTKNKLDLECSEKLEVLKKIKCLEDSQKQSEILLKQKELEAAGLSKR